MLTTFFMASHDYISSPEPRECHLIGIVPGYRRSDYMLVKVFPALPGNLIGRAEGLETIILATCETEKTIEDVKSGPVMVDILAPTENITNKINELSLRKIGVGTLHGALPEARKYSPLD